jgi:hypothetical protein
MLEWDPKKRPDFITLSLDILRYQAEKKKDFQRHLVYQKQRKLTMSKKNNMIEN